jgi:hypothetical protein
MKERIADQKGIKKCNVPSVLIKLSKLWGPPFHATFYNKLKTISFSGMENICFAM